LALPRRGERASAVGGGLPEEAYFTTGALLFLCAIRLLARDHRKNCTAKIAPPSMRPFVADAQHAAVFCGRLGAAAGQPVFALSPPRPACRATAGSRAKGAGSAGL